MTILVILLLDGEMLFIREEEDEIETKVWDLDEHGSLVGSDEDEEHEDGEKEE
ncbi:hypothetical protein J1N35_025660 [Gossypium stocksii]|uniref:Uncharacterized protein n=1 Tax=Gossypium stocksii TaxID=47602 RepID=A0A9D3V6S9_9ROSI|nr:hypothetical protein J1N35_025660 [Gossypium stocksii]